MFRTQDLMFPVGGNDADFTAVMCFCVTNFTSFDCYCYTYGVGQAPGAGQFGAARCEITCGKTYAVPGAAGFAHAAPAGAHGAAWITSPVCGCITNLPVTNIGCYCVTLPAQGQAPVLNVTDPTCLCVTSREEGAQQALAHVKAQLQKHLEAVAEAEKALAENGD